MQRGWLRVMVPYPLVVLVEPVRLSTTRALLRYLNTYFTVLRKA